MTCNELAWRENALDSHTLPHEKQRMGIIISPYSLELRKVSLRKSILDKKSEKQCLATFAGRSRQGNFSRQFDFSNCTFHLCDALCKAYISRKMADGKATPLKRKRKSEHAPTPKRSRALPAQTPATRLEPGKDSEDVAPTAPTGGLAADPPALDESVEDTLSHVNGASLPADSHETEKPQRKRISALGNWRLSEPTAGHYIDRHPVFSADEK